jgi:uncharacterized membrane protein
VNAASWGLLVATFVACFVEMVEATTIVMAMGFTRGWRSALYGTGVAVGALAAVTAVAGYAITTWVSRSALELAIGTLLLIFGLQWLRKAILRASGRKALHDEDEIYREEVAAAQAAGAAQPAGLDWFGFVVSFKGVFLEGMEVVFIVITFGLNAKDVPIAVVGAGAAVAAVLGLAIALRRPLSMVPENTLKYVVGLMLATFGTFWSVEGIGVFRSGQQGVSWPGGDAALPVLLVAWFLLTRVFIAVLRRDQVTAPRAAGATPVESGAGR